MQQHFFLFSFFWATTVYEGFIATKENDIKDEFYMFSTCFSASRNPLTFFFLFTTWSFGASSLKKRTGIVLPEAETYS